MNDINRDFSRDKNQTGHPFMEERSTSLDIGEMQVRTSTRYHRTQVRMAAIQKSVTVLVGTCRKGTLTYCRWQWKLVEPLWRTAWRSLRMPRADLGGLWAQQGCCQFICPGPTSERLASRPLILPSSRGSLGGAAGMARSLGSCTHTEDLDGVPGTWL